MLCCVLLGASLPKQVSITELISAALLSLTADRHPVLLGPGPANRRGVYKNHDEFRINTGFRPRSRVVTVHRVLVSEDDKLADRSSAEASRFVLLLVFVIVCVVVCGC